VRNDRLLQSRIPSSIYKMAIFTVVTVVLIGLLATLIGNISFVPSRTYRAVFTDATGVFAGDRVRLSGVEVGTVKSVKLSAHGEGQQAMLEFTVENEVPLYRNARLELRFENIVGQRYLSIKETAGAGELMRPGATFPVDQTTPALSLTVLFNGFQPLFRALDPKETNKLSYELVRVLQGESGTIRNLMQSTASLTNTLADKDEVIGQVVDNLNVVLDTVGERDRELTALIVQFRNLMGGLAKDGDVIGAALPSLARLLDGTSGLIAEVRGPLKYDIGQLNILAGQVVATKGELNDSLKTLPRKLRALIRTGSHGSWFNFYVCGLDLQLQLPGGTAYLQSPALVANERDTVCGGGEQ
jgi:phospholipid/cholesterol/gamma-HCH transport system substrate-binding protein